jgi:MSHA biogenesis protein MshO
MWRYEAYAFGPNIPTIADPFAPPGGFSPQLVARNVTNCAFGYDAGTSTRAALVSMTITLSQDGESVTLMHQVHVENAP